MNRQQKQCGALLLMGWSIMEENKAPRRSPLMEIERQTRAEGREWTRKRLQQRLQELADKDGEISPPQRPQAEADQAANPAPEDHGGRSPD